MSFLNKLFAWGQSSPNEQKQSSSGMRNPVYTPNKGSAKKAKERLQIILSHDRTDISPELMETLRTEMIKVLKNYMEIDETRIEMDIGEGGMALAVNIPVVNVRRSPSEDNK